MNIKRFIEKFVPSFLLSYYHLSLSFLGALFNGFPSRQMKVIGITGTSGKTTVVQLASLILEEAGYKVASVSSIRFKIGKGEWENKLKMTMPGRMKLQGFLRKALLRKCQYAVLEVTSEGILQYRHRFIDFDVAVFTNLWPEHIERHGGFEKYRAAKGELFKATPKIHIVNLDDENAEYFIHIKSKEKWGYRLKSEKSKPFLKKLEQNLKVIEAENCHASREGIKFSIDNLDFHLSLLGTFNIYNALAAICIGRSQGVSLETCKKALEKIKIIPGRMELVIEQPFKVYVDYAHTPQSLERVYQTIKGQNLENLENRGGKLICVLGACGGGRDKWKRPVLGKIAATYCDKVIVTNEDPYDENPVDIINQVARGAGVKAEKVSKRREAIRRALKSTSPGDTVIITGKGSEPWMCLKNGKKIPWDDRQVVKEEFSRLQG